jgi:integral membrane sensor domain MASE1
VLLFSKAGVWLSLHPASIVSPLWPASGLAVAALLRFGPRLATGIWLGTLASDLLAGDPLPFLLLGPLGNTLEALTAWWLLTHVWPIDSRLGRARDVLRFFVGGVALPPLLSASLGVSGLCAGGVLPMTQFAYAASLYVVANASGILMVAPFLLSLRVASVPEPEAKSPIARYSAAAFVPYSALIFAILLGFGNPRILEIGGWPLAYLPFPCVVWIAFAQGVRGAALASLLVSLSGTLFTLFGHGPFAAAGTLQSLSLLVTYNALTAATALLLAAVRAELAASEARTRDALSREAEWQSLRAQVQPHFLFNALNSLRRLIHADPQAARVATSRLAAFLRSSLRANAEATVPLRNEFAAIENYLQLEHLRLEGRLRPQLQLSPDAADTRLPPLVLQTLVENAIKHGIARRIDGGELLVTASLIDRVCLIRVTHPAAPDSAPAAEPSDGLGLRNARLRLRLACGEHATIRLLSAPPGAITAEIIIPLPDSQHP